MTSLFLSQPHLIQLHWLNLEKNEILKLKIIANKLFIKKGYYIEKKIEGHMIDKVLSKSKLISLDEESHTYSLSDSEIKFQSVTEFIHTFFNPFDEQKIAKKLTETNIKYKGMTVEELIASWNKRRDRGTVVHKEIEEYINSNFKIKDELNIDSKSIQGINFLNQKCIKESNILASEVIIFSEKLKLAGTIDLLIYNKKRIIFQLLIGRQIKKSIKILLITQEKE